MRIVTSTAGRLRRAAPGASSRWLWFWLALGASGTVSCLHAGTTVDFGGSCKNTVSAISLGSAASSMVSGDSLLLDDLQRLRIELRQDSSSVLAWEVAYELRMAWGESVPLYRLVSQQGIGPVNAGGWSLTRPRFFDLECELLNESNVLVLQTIDRLNVSLRTDTTSLCLGRQAVSWGGGVLWTPTDLFAAFSPITIDRDYKLGVDVVRMMWHPGPDTDFDVVLEPLGHGSHGRATSKDSTAALRMRTRAGECEISACGGYVAGDWVAGGDFAGYVRNAGVHGEVLYTWADGPGAENYLRGLLGVDYAWASRWQPYVLLEYYFNGAGASSPATYPDVLANPSVLRGLERGTTFNVGRHYLGAVIRLTLSDLLTFHNLTAWNLDDGSVREVVFLAMSTSDNSELRTGINFGMGGAASEFGGASSATPSMGMLSADMFFACWNIHF